MIRETICVEITDVATKFLTIKLKIKSVIFYIFQIEILIF
jgi:hypothetical protein